jgi:hypothetical protein
MLNWRYCFSQEQVLRKKSLKLTTRRMRNLVLLAMFLNDDGNKEENKFLWQLNNYNSSLWMNLSSEPHPVDPSLSVDPYQFLRIFISN